LAIEFAIVMLDYVDRMRVVITADFKARCATVTQGQAQMQC
jgi:hypothetical protein